MLTPGEARRIGGKDTSAKQVVLDYVSDKIRKSAQQGGGIHFRSRELRLQPDGFRGSHCRVEGAGLRHDRRTVRQSTAYSYLVVAQPGNLLEEIGGWISIWHTSQ